jgi:ABC-2 type transport system permease protein
MDAIRCDAEVIWLLCRRQIVRYLRSRSRLIGTLGQPLMFLVALGLGLERTFARAGQGSYLQFLTPGVVCMSILVTSMGIGAELIWDRRSGFAREMLIAPTRGVVIAAGRTIGGALVAAGQGLMVAACATVVGFRLSVRSAAPEALLFVVLVALLFTAAATLLATTVDDAQGFSLVSGLGVTPTFFLSGALFPIDGMPPAMRAIAYLNPLSYGVDGLRAAVSGTHYFGAAVDAAVLLSVTALLLLAIGADRFRFERSA